MGFQISLCQFHKNSLSERLLEGKDVTRWDELTEHRAVSQKASFQYWTQDISFFTIVLYGLPNITLANSFLNQDDVRLIEKKDYIENPKENGYRSLHLIVEIPIFLSDEKKWVKVEVQFRTIAMDFWASLEHKIRYKKNLSKERLNEIDKELLECAKICKTLDEKMEEIKTGN